MRVPSLRPYDLPKTPPPSTVPLGFRVSTWLPRGHTSIPSIGTKLFLGYACELHRVLLFATPWTVTHKASLSMECSRQEYWSGLLFSPPGDLPDPEIQPTSPVSPALAGGFFAYWAVGNAYCGDLCLGDKILDSGGKSEKDTWLARWGSVAVFVPLRPERMCFMYLSASLLRHVRVTSWFTAQIHPALNCPTPFCVCVGDWWYLIEDRCSEYFSGRKAGSFEPQDWKQARFCWWKDWKSAYQMVWEGKTEFHFRLWKCELKVAQSCPTLSDPVDYSPPGSSVHGILQARILDWVAIPFSRGSSWPRDWTWVSCIAGIVFIIWATGETLKIRRLRLTVTLLWWC